MSCVGWMDGGLPRILEAQRMLGVQMCFFLPLTDSLDNGTWVVGNAVFSIHADQLKNGQTFEVGIY